MEHVVSKNTQKKVKKIRARQDISHDDAELLLLASFFISELCYCL